MLFKLFYMIILKNVNKTFKSELFTKPFTALKDLSFKVEEGKVTGFLGANGAGKTTSIKIIMDFVRLSSGFVEFDNSLGQSKEEVFKNIGFLPEKSYFYPYLTGREFCFYMGELVDLNKKEIKDKIQYWSPKFKIEFALDRKIRTYSKGMLQRIGFLVTLLHDPKLIILDEPLSGLDPIGRKELKDVILELKEMGKTIFFSSHIISDVEEVSDQVIFIKDGRLIYEGSVQDILEKSDKGLVEIRFSQDEEIRTIKINRSEKSKKLKSLVNQDIDILSVNNVKMSLEEVFYNV